MTISQTPSRIWVFGVLNKEALVFVQQDRDFELQSYLKNKITGQNMNYSLDIPETTHNNQKLEVLQLQQPSLQQKTKRKHLKSTKKPKVKISSFSWNRAEERKYITFLKNNGKLFNLTPKQRKQIKINVMMSYAIKSRTSSQCHSHHQKLLIKYGSIQSIIDNHGLLFTKQQKGEVEAKPILNTESTVEPSQLNRQIHLESFFGLQEKVQEEPIWWGYLDLHEYEDEPLWNNVDFFSQ